MSSLGRIAAAGAIALLFGLTSREATAQGVTTAAVRGVVRREAGGQLIESAVVTLINTPRGTRQRTITSGSGRYFFENVEVGGPYTIEISAIGFETTSKTGVILTLGQRYESEFNLRAQAVVLEELEITATTDPLINSSRTGPSQITSDSAISRLPLLGRSWTSLFNTSPQVTGTNTVTGQNNRFNTILVDGAVNNDVFGLASSGTPGGQASVKPLSIEAIKEFQVLVAPFDIRQGGFTGGLFNAVSKSGTNSWTGSLFTYFQNQDLVGKDTAGLEVTEFRVKQYGGTLGGPIIRDKLHFFVSADIQGRDAPFFGREVTEPATGISAATADRVTNYIRSNLGYDPGDYAPPVLGTPNANVFSKLSAQVGNNHLLELTYNYVKGHQDEFARGNGAIDRDGFQLSNSGYEQSNTTNSLRGKWFGQFGRVNTEVIAAYQQVRDARTMPNITPQLQIQGDVLGRWISAGGEQFSHGNSLDQDSWELTANATFGVGSHMFTVGTHNERYDFLNLFYDNKYGTWSFLSADSLEKGLATRYARAVPTEAKPNGPIADWGTTQLGFYLQDQWSPSPRFTLTLGLRGDVPFQDSPSKNEALADIDELGNIDTSEFPSGNWNFSPRLGFNYDIFGSGQTILRGGIGIFSGRPPGVWMSNAFGNTGLEFATLLCQGTVTPDFTADISNMPSACKPGGADPSSPIPTINYFDPEFKFQQALKYALGLDQQLPGGVVGTIDFAYTEQRNTMYVTDINLNEGPVNAEGRQMYGTIAATASSAVASRKTSKVREALEGTNRDGGYNVFVTGQLAKRFGRNFEFLAAYTWSRTKDLMSLSSSRMVSNFRFTTLDGTIDRRNLTTSAFDTPQKIVMSGTFNIPLGFQMGLIYTGFSGRPYAWAVDNDVNGDGQSQNDLVYVPRSASDISLSNPNKFDTLNTFIASEPCLREQRGRIMTRNSCRNPWNHFLDVRLAKVITTWQGQALEISADVFNFLNLIHSEWGLNRQTTGFENALGLLTLNGLDNRGTADPADDRPRYTVPSVMPSRERVSVGSSRWRMQFGIKYVW
jgi:hypothetical protein